MMNSFSNLRKSALKAYMDSKRRRRRITLGRVVIVVIALALVIGGLAYVATVHASTLAQFLNPVTISEFVSSLTGTESGATDPDLVSGPEGSAPALPTAVPTATPTETHPATQTIKPTATPHHTSTPIETRTPSATRTEKPTASPSPTPSETAEGSPPPTATPTPTMTPTATGFPGCNPSGNSSYEFTLLNLINGERESNGLPAYSLQGQLEAAARAHTTDMACNSFFSHIGSDGSSEEDRATESGYEWASVRENIFATGDTSSNAPQLALSFWLASPPNQANILHEEFTEIGIGYTYVPSSPFGGYFTVVFARP